MELIWAILGALLITLVGGVCFVFFVIRPRVGNRVRAAAELLSKELYGQPPLMSAPASCEGCSDPDRAGLKGIGAIALTEQAVVFASGQTKDTVIIPRTAINSSYPTTSFSYLGRTVKRSVPMLVLQWRVNRTGLLATIAFSLTEPLDWAAALPAMPLSPDALADSDAESSDTEQ